MAVHKDKGRCIATAGHPNGLKTLATAQRGLTASLVQRLLGVKMVRHCCHSPVIVYQHWAGDAGGFLDAKGVPAGAARPESQQQQYTVHWQQHLCRQDLTREQSAGRDSMPGSAAPGKVVPRQQTYAGSTCTT